MAEKKGRDGLTGREKLDQAYECIRKEIPDFIWRGIAWLRRPEHGWVRIPAAIILIGGSAFFILPVVGLEWLPLGLLLIAEDVPILRRPTAVVLIWMVNRWIDLRRWIKRRFA